MVVENRLVVVAPGSCYMRDSRSFYKMEAAVVADSCCMIVVVGS